MDVEASAAPASQSRRGGGSVWTIAYFVLLTAVAITAFVLGCYSTDKVRSLLNPPAEVAMLTSNPSTVPPGYTVYSLGTGLGYWSSAADMSFPRSDHGVIAYGKYAYLIGGLTSNTTLNVTTNTTESTPYVLKALVRYDMETGEMLRMKDLPQPRHRFAYALLRDTIYVMGGTDKDNGDPMNTVFVYNISTGNWTEQGPSLKIPRVDPCGAAVNGKVYVFGGYGSDFVSLATTEEYDPATATSSDVGGFKLLDSANLTTSRGDCRAAAVNGIIYAVGGTEWWDNPIGCDGDEWVNCYRFLNSVEAFDGKKWTARAPMINTRGDFGIEVLPGNRIIVAGGERGNGTKNSMSMYDVEEYHIDDNIWVAKAPLPEARFRDDLAYVSGRVYAFGGAPTCGLTTDSNASCAAVALKTVFAYSDIQVPRLYAFFKAVPANSTNDGNTTGTR